MHSAFADDLSQRYVARTPCSAELYARAVEVLPGGDTRTGTFYAPYPIFMARGEGSRLIDVDGNRYVDFMGNFTSLVHGNAHPAVAQVIAGQSALGAAFPFPGVRQVELAEEIQRRIPSIARLRFCNSGTEAVMGAIRAARAFTGRAKILKMEGGYHGSYDAAQVSVAPSGTTPFPVGTPTGPGLSPGMVAEVLVAPFNDLETASAIVQRHRHELAAVIVEPCLTAAGVIPATTEFLRGLRDVTREAGVLLILDEIVTLRLAYGGGQEHYGLTGAMAPDLTTLAKIIGGGLPVGAFGGRADVMAHFDPRRAGAIGHSGTFNGNATTMAAGLATLGLLTRSEIDRINILGQGMRQGMQQALDVAGVTAHVTGIGSLAHVHFRAPAVTSYRDTLGSNREWTRALHLGLLTRGFVCAPRGMFAASTAMTRADVDALVLAVAALAEEARAVAGVA